MNAPSEPAALPILAKIAEIEASPTNPRQRFPAEAHAELVASVKAHGILQPLLLRPWPEHHPAAFPDTTRYEIVAGERRWRAAKDAGLADVLAVVRDLTDVQVLEMQIVENLHREDVHPLEEAEGYQRLMNDAGYDADTLSETVGKSRAYIYARLKLLDLCPEAREAFYENTLDASTALLVARIPGKVLQKRAVKELTQGYSAPPSYRVAKDLVRRNYMLRLKEAPFKPSDTSLAPAAGSCTDCPKRTGNNPDLFSDVDDADVCTDPGCFEDKCEANYRRLKEKATKRGAKILEGTEARKVMPYGTSSLGGGYVSLDDRCEDDAERRTYRQILGKEAPVAAVIETNPTYNDKHMLVEVADKKVLAEALKKAGITPGAKKEDPEEKDRAAKKAADDAAVEIEKAWRARLFQAMREKFLERFADANMPALEELTLIAVALFERRAEFDDNIEPLMDTWGHPIKEGIDEQDQIDTFTWHIIGLDAPNICLFLADLALIDETEVRRYAFLENGEQPERLLAEAKRLGIDAEGLRMNIERERKASEKPQPKAKKPAKPAPTPSPAAQAQEERGAKPAAPATAKGAKKPAAKKPEEKADPAPAAPANEPAAPVKTSGLEPVTPWPFQVGSRA